MNQQNITEFVKFFENNNTKSNEVKNKSLQNSFPRNVKQRDTAKVAAGTKNIKEVDNTQKSLL